MCTYYRTIKDGSVKEFKFEFNQNIYRYRHSEIEFHFTVYDDYAAFTIDTARFTNMGYGTALLSIMFEIINEKHQEFKFICGKLSTSDYYDHGNNWKISIPFYLKQRKDAFLIKCPMNFRLAYCNTKHEDFLKNKYYRSEDFTTEITNGYIIYPLNKINI